MKNKKIKFEARDAFFYDFAEKPVPSIKAMPDWWKRISKYANLPGEDPDRRAVTVKQCGPTLDALGAGYLIKLWADIKVYYENGEQKISFFIENPPLSQWDSRQVSEFEIPEGFNNNVYKYNHGWVIKTPRNWSTLFINPIGYKNLPFKTIEGLVDTDILKTDINCPIVIKKDFEGIIPRGTPIAQIIPIKRAKWKSEILLPNKRKTFDKEQKKLFDYGTGYYLSIRDRKSYK